MKIKDCRFIPYTLDFIRPAGTSRGILKQKLTYFLCLTLSNSVKLYSECGLLRGLSIDDRPEYTSVLQSVCNFWMEKGELPNLTDWPSIQCGHEMLLGNYNNYLSTEKKDVYQKNDFIDGSSIPINGLIWMGDPNFMKKQIHEKVNNGYRCIKMKVGAIDWSEEKKLLHELRNAGGKELIIRVDANGAWAWNDDIKHKMDELYHLDIHSIEQPIGTKQWDDLAALSSWSPVDIALDEELFGISTLQEKKALLEKVDVSYLVLKPSLVGGFSACEEWISIASSLGMKYWITSALESNIGLNAIAQYTFPHQNTVTFQGLGTGSLYTNNIDSPLEIVQDTIQYNTKLDWNYNTII